MSELQEKLNKMDMWQQQLTAAQNLPAGAVNLNLVNSQPSIIDPSDPESVQKAIQENLNLRIVAKKIQNDLDNQIQQNKELGENMNNLQTSANEAKNSLKNFQLAFRDLQIDYEKSSKFVSNFNNIKNTKEQEIKDLARELKMAQDENSHLTNQMKMARSQISHEGQDMSSLKQKSDLNEKRAESLKEKLAKKNEEIQEMNEKYNTAQMRYFTINQEYESLKQSTSREIQSLSNNLKSSQQQNKVIIKLKLEAEQQLKNLQANGGGNNDKLIAELTDYKEINRALEDTNKVLAQKQFGNDPQGYQRYMQQLGEMKSKVRGSMSGGASSAQTQRLKQQLQESIQMSQKMKAINERLIRQFDREMKAIKTQYQSMNKGFNLSQSTFRLKTDEYKKLKDEKEILIQDKKSLIGQLKTVKILQERITNDFEDVSEQLETKNAELENSLKKIKSQEQTIANLAGDQMVEVKQKLLKEVMAENNILEGKIKELNESLEDRNNQYDSVVAAGREISMKLRNLKNNADAEAANQDGGMSSSAKITPSMMEDDFDFNFTEGGVSKLDFISQKVVKKGLKEIADCLKDLSQFSDEVMARPIQNDEDFKTLTAGIRRMIDSLMVKETTVQRRELNLEKNVTRMKLIEKEVNNLKKRTEILTGATKIFASGSNNPRSRMRSGIQTPQNARYNQQKMMMMQQMKSRTRMQSGAPSRQELAGNFHQMRKGVENQPPSQRNHQYNIPQGGYKNRLPSHLHKRAQAEQSYSSNQAYSDMSTADKTRKQQKF